MGTTNLFKTAGSLYWYQHDGRSDGKTQWTGKNLVGDGGWQQYTTVFAGGDKTLYAIRPDGTLYWYRHDGQADGTQQWTGKNLVGLGGWQKYISVFSGGGNIIYAIDHDGNLYWYRHDGHADGTQQWTGRNLVGRGGWQKFVSVFSGGGDIIYAIDHQGNLYWYRHDGQADGTERWTGKKRVGTGWLRYQSVFCAGNGIFYGRDVDTTSWMSCISPSSKLNQFTIPGTHDTGTWPLSEGNAKCQSLSLEQQLNAGIRFIDIRLVQEERNGQNDFQIWHGSSKVIGKNTGLWFSTDIVDVCKAFLSNHPTETIIMSVKDEFGSTDHFETNLLNYLDPSFCLLGTTVPTLKEARGHIVLFRRYEFEDTDTPARCGIPAREDWPNDEIGQIPKVPGPNYTGTIMHIQDIYGFGFWDDWADDIFISKEERAGKVKKKWSFVEQHLMNARAETDDHAWWINFTSASGPPGIMNPVDFVEGVPGYESGINAKLNQFLTTNRSGYFGTVMMDMPEQPDNGVLIKHLIRTNLNG